MCDGSRIVRDRQRAIRREMDRRGIHLKIVAADSGISPSSMASYFPADASVEPAQMPTGVLFTLLETKALPDDLLSLMLPAGFQIVRVPEDVDHDEAAQAMHDYLAAKTAAHHPDSPGGRDIAPCEDAALRTKLTAVGSAAA
ncbi:MULTISPECIES: hypothetical protein [unclassified Blastomonas]|uniref:hypothetical protein n=1 Tax=unclassified Blastomonas TaxID=2626550 RepID=UPI0008258C3B|nr:MULTISPECIES: hypothetical protein [unclassified Blastomonas]